MHLTDYHAKYIAYELTRRFPPDNAEKLAGVVASAQVDLNPHQVDAALFAFNSPLSKGALLADEVGLGKTIEAGLVLSQKWAERKRCILVITPSNLRKQWFQELTEKFFLPCRILEAKPYNAAIRQGQFRPFEVHEIVICSYQFAKSKAGDVQAVPWDLVVIDEAHRLRNVYKPSNVIANTLKMALAGKDKRLLTAMPLQNSLLELFGRIPLDPLVVRRFAPSKQRMLSATPLSRARGVRDNQWFERHQGSDRVTGSRSADMRSEVVKKLAKAVFTPPNLKKGDHCTRETTHTR